MEISLLPARPPRHTLDDADDEEDEDLELGDDSARYVPTTYSIDVPEQLPSALVVVGSLGFILAERERKEEIGLLRVDDTQYPVWKFRKTPCIHVQALSLNACFSMSQALLLLAKEVVVMAALGSLDALESHQLYTKTARPLQQVSCLPPGRLLSNVPGAILSSFEYEGRPAVVNIISETADDEIIKLAAARVGLSDIDLANARKNYWNSSRRSHSDATSMYI